MKIRLSAVVCWLLFANNATAQQDPEFSKGFIAHLKLHNGMITNFKSNTPDLYVGGFQLVPQYGIVPQVLRAGLIVDVFYTGKKIQAAFGPTVSIKIKTLHADVFGSIGNIHISADHLWGTEHQKLIGGGINADLGNKLIVALTTHYDYAHCNWWFQSSVGIRISKKISAGGGALEL